jgi:hypothetical protein
MVRVFERVSTALSGQLVYVFHCDTKIDGRPCTLEEFVGKNAERASTRYKMRRRFQFCSYEFSYNKETR